MRIVLLLTAALLLWGEAFAQSGHLCASDSLWKMDTSYQQKQSAFAAELAEFRTNPPTTHNYWPYVDTGNSTNTIIPGCKKAVYIIPIVVHIDTSGGTVNVSDTQVYQQLEILNARFENYGIRFVLAQRRPNGTSFSGINRFGGTFDYRFQNLAAAYAASNTRYYDPEKYFNIYVAPNILASDGSPSTIGGFNQRFADMGTGADMVVVRYTKFGDYTNCASCGTLTSNSKGLTLVHEAGHYLGLRELWQGGCAEGNNAATCANKGDLCCDTRPINANYSCPAPGGNDCSYHLSIADNHENYMDYTGEACQTNFTADQVSLMQATLERYRSKQVTPKNLNALGLNDCFASAWFDSDENFACDSGVFTLRAIEYDSVLSYQWIIRRNGVIFFDTTLTSDSLVWTADSIGVYSVTLEIKYGSLDSSEVTRTSFLQVADCGTTIASDQGNWFFGDHAGLKFTAGGVIRNIEPWKRNPFNINTSEGTISHSKNNGQLLFYGGGTVFNPGYMEIYNRNYVQMPNSPILGDFSACQSAAVLPMTGDTNRFMLLSVSGIDASNQKGFRYSIIDMSLNGGLGDIDATNKDIPIAGPAGFTVSPLDSAILVNEQITVIPKCNGQDYWVLVTNLPDNPPFPMNIFIYSVDTNGITYVGKTDTIFKKIGVGQLKASPDGNWLYFWGKLLRFDKSTGIITPYRTLISNNPEPASFSPNSKLLYAMNTNSELFQFDLQSGNDSLSKTKITDFPIISGFTNLQLGPDNRVYISKYGYSNLAVINSPDSNVTKSVPNAPQYSFNGPVLASNGIGGMCMSGLPNMRDAKLPAQIPLTFTMIDSACGHISFIPSNACAGSYKWFFGDGDSSSLREPKHTYGDTGLYTVTLTVNGTQTVQKEIFIGIHSKIQGTDTACILNGNPVSYSISHRDDENTYTWSVANGTPTIDPYNNLAVNWSAGAGKVILNMSNPNNGCVSTDTLSIIPNFLDSNRIWADTALCFSGKPLKLFGNTTVSSMGGVKYLWESSKNAQAWGKTGNGDTLQNLTGIIQDTTLYYRRIAKQGNCQFMSNWVRIAPVLIKKNLVNSAFCPGGTSTTRTFPIELQFDTPQTVTLQRYHYNETSPGTWQWTAGSVVSYPNDLPTIISDGDSVKILITLVGCGSTFSNTAFLKLPKPSAYGSHTEVPCSTVTLKNDLSNLAFGVDTFYYVQLDSTVAWLHQAPNSDSFFRWEKYNKQTGSWEEVPNSNNDTLFLTIGYCIEGSIYRPKVRFANMLNTACTWVYPCSTDTINLKTDLWAKDGAADTGAEPNIDPNRDYWGSPDLWNCWPDSTCTTHKKPEFMEFNSNNWNNLRAVVRNKGTETSGTFEVKTYWTVGGFYEQWPLSWHYDTVNNGIYDSITMQRNPMGGEIGTYLDSNLTAGNSRIYTFQWKPPYPGWYGNSSYFNNSKISHPLCVLSRIVTCPDTPFGMTYPEVAPTGENMINNNKIVTRNTEVYDSIGSNKKSPEWVLRMGNQWSEQRKIRLTIDNPVTNYWDLGYYVVQLDPVLYNAWEEGGSAGEGYILDGYTFIVEDDGFYLENITLEAGQWGWAHFEFRLHEETVMDEDRGQQVFRFVQYSAPTGSEVYEPDGGFNFQLNLQPDTAYLESHVDSLDFIIVPNPTENTETVAIEIDMNFASSTAVLNIYDQWGNPMIDPMGLGTLTVGENTRTVYIAELSAGSYSAVITANGQNYTETMIILE
ncbi:MAG: T9SS type A sorting domain-containing protein [Bacteroidetes bacterium]|nr:MAG: T9SS type A sorting domain-containing protein [Bacteroidota bacterium]